MNDETRDKGSVMTSSLVRTVSAAPALDIRHSDLVIRHFVRATGLSENQGSRIDVATFHQNHV
jgi:hypothetical protein